jgi:hypothetical protein
MERSCVEMMVSQTGMRNQVVAVEREYQNKCRGSRYEDFIVGGT